MIKYAMIIGADLGSLIAIYIFIKSLKQILSLC